MALRRSTVLGATRTSVSAAAAPPSPPLLHVKLRLPGSVHRFLLEQDQVSYAGLRASLAELARTDRVLATIAGGPAAWALRYHDGDDPIVLASEQDFGEALRLIVRRGLVPNEIGYVLEVFLHVPEVDPRAAAAASASASAGLADVQPPPPMISLAPPPQYETLEPLGGTGAVAPGTGVTGPIVSGLAVMLPPALRVGASPVLEVVAIISGEVFPALVRAYGNMAQRRLTTFDGWRRRIQPMTTSERVVFSVAAFVFGGLPVYATVQAIASLVGPILSAIWSVTIVSMALLALNWAHAAFATVPHRHATVHVE